MRARRVLGRLALVGLGLLLALALVEVGLRIAAGRLERAAPLAAGGDAFDVLCVGDSYTYGLGSEDGRGYPEHLQHLLEAGTDQIRRQSGRAHGLSGIRYQVSASGLFMDATGAPTPWIVAGGKMDGISRKGLS